MKRDMDLVREILLAVEAFKIPPSKQLKIDGFDDDVVGYHVGLMSDAGLIETAPPERTCAAIGRPLKPVKLTWQGHDLLEAIRPPERWDQVKGIAIKAGAVTIEGMKAIASNLVTELAMKLVKGQG